jgi:predicted nucleic acid-binding protein
MGVILDSTAVIKAQRAHEAPTAFVKRIVFAVGRTELALSAIGYTELIHGLHRSNSPERFRASRAFLDDLILELPIYSYTRDIAELAGKIDAEQKLRGVTIPYADLLIGSTALFHGFDVLTSNVRHFGLMPELKILTL